MSPEPGDLICLRSGCTQLAIDGWWVGDAHLFRYACADHAEAERTADTPDGIHDQPPGFVDMPWGTDSNPANVPKPATHLLHRAARPARHMDVEHAGSLAQRAGVSSVELRTVMGDGYVSLNRLSDWSLSYATYMLMFAWLLNGVSDDY